jgi:predicted ArsR family transcriptional regulator
VSFHLVNLAWQRDMRAAQKIRVLSAKCGLSASAVRSQIKSLQAIGLVDVEMQSDGTVYRVKLGAAA